MGLHDCASLKCLRISPIAKAYGSPGELLQSKAMHIKQTGNAKLLVGVSACGIGSSNPLKGWHNTLFCLFNALLSNISLTPQSTQNYTYTLHNLCCQGEVIFFSLFSVNECRFQQTSISDNFACNGLICPLGGAVYYWIIAIFSPGLYRLHIIIFYLQTAELDWILLFSLSDEGNVMISAGATATTTVTSAPETF